jgi:Phosphoesterase family
MPGSRECPLGSACNPIQHIVIMDKENRSFDSMFGTFPGANGAATYRDPHGQTLLLNHQPDRLPSDLGHDPANARTAFDGGRMDGFSLESSAIQGGEDMADSQLYRSDIPDYWAYARTFTLDDAFFSTVMGPSFPNHLFTIAAQDANVVDNPTAAPWGCDSPAGTKVVQQAPDGTKSLAAPCFDFEGWGTFWKRTSYPGPTTLPEARTPATSGPLSTPSSTFDLAPIGRNESSTVLSLRLTLPLDICRRSAGSSNLGM